MPKTKTKDEFISEAILVHGDKYDYNLVIYVNSKTKVKIICKKHGEFKQTPSNHLYGFGCLLCGIEKGSANRRSNIDEFISKAIKLHGDIYIYDKVIYLNSDTKVIIICKKHGEFEQTPDCHLQKQGCPKCGIENMRMKQRKSLDQFIIDAKEKHGEDTFIYDKVIYVNTDTKVIIICKKHGEFEQTPYHHLNGQCCPLCINKTEGKLYIKIKKIYPTLQIQFKHDWCMKKSYLPYDFCIPEYKIIIELDGAQHFKQVANWSSPEEQFENDKYKEECANQNGYSVIRLLQEDVFYDTYDWVKELCYAIEEVKSSEGITNVYLCKNGEYDQF